MNRYQIDDRPVPKGTIKDVNWQQCLDDAEQMLVALESTFYTGINVALVVSAANLVALLKTKVGT